MKRILCLLCVVSVFAVSFVLTMKCYAIVPEQYNSFTYDDSAELVRALENDFDENLFQELDANGLENQKKRIIDFLAKASDKGIYTVLLGGQELNTNGVQLFLNDLYEETNVYYTSAVESTGIQYVQWMYLDNAADGSTIDLLEQIKPKGSRNKYPDYSSVQEKKILISGKELDCVVGRFQHDSRSYITFVYDGALFRIVGDDKLDSSNSLSMLKFQKKECNIDFGISTPDVPKFNTYGDIDNDNHITSNDALTILRASVGIETITPELFTIADIDSDGYITANDALAVLRSSVGIIDNIKTH